MQGRLETVEVESAALATNPLGDPSRRSLLVYLPPGFDPRGPGLPAVYFLHAFGGAARTWSNFSGFAPPVPERLDDLVASGRIPPAVGVFADGWTGLGGSQWVNSPALGRYRDYLAQEVVPYVDSRWGTLPRPEARAVVGKSSGGYGALVMGRHHPEVFGHVGCHAGDSFFEYCYLPDFPRAAGALLGTDPARWLADFRRRARETKLRPDDHAVLSTLAMAAAYSPKAGEPLGLDLPFDAATGRLRPEVWARWLEHDPVRFVAAHPEPFRRLRSLYLDCGSRDEFHLRWGTRMVSEALRLAGVDHLHEEFEDGHRDINYRFDRSLSFLVPRLARG
jgi:hypothetical protein